MNEYFVSIVVPLYNSAKVIEETLSYLMEQTCDNYEILLIDDGSTDNTYEVVDCYVNTRKNVFYYKKENGGVASARNYGIKVASGNIIALCDHDDWWHPAKLSKQIRLFESPEIGLVYAGARTLNIKEKADFSTSDSGKVYYEGADCFYKLLQDNCIPTASVIFRKSCIDKVGLFDERKEIMGVDDRHMWLRIALNYNIAVVRETLVNHRITGSNWSLQEEKMLKSAIFCLDDISQRYPPRSRNDRRLMQNAYAITYQHYGDNLFYRGDYSTARRCFFYSLRYNFFCRNMNFFFLLLSCMPGFIVTLVKEIKSNLKLF